MQSGNHEIVGAGALRADVAVHFHSFSVMRKKLVILVQGSFGGTRTTEHFEMSLDQLRLYRTEIVRLKELRLQKLAHARYIVPRRLEIGVGEESMRGVAQRGSGHRLPSF